MKNKIFMAILAFILMYGCRPDDSDWSPQQEGVRLSLTIGLGTATAHQSRAMGVHLENENKIYHLDCFFYPLNGGEQAPAVLHFSRDFSGTQTTTLVEESLSKEEIARLYPSGVNTCRVYVVANLPQGMVEADELPSIAAMKQLLIDTPVFAQQTMPIDFVMDSRGNDEVRLDCEQETLTGTVTLMRAAAKISLTILSVKELVEQDGEGNEIVWTAKPEEMQVYMHSGVKRSHVDAERYPYVPVSEDDYYHTPHDQAIGYHEVVTTLPDGGVSRTWEQNLPFYSYPSDWSEEEVNAPFLLLVVPWHKSTEDDNHFYNCYYQIALHSADEQLLRNHYYKINLTVSTLGSFVEEKPEIITPSYVILDWNTNTIDAQLEHYRYLMVTSDHVELNNLNGVKIPFFSSHTAKITQVRCTRPDLSENIVVEEEVDRDRYTLKLEDGNIIFQHSLNNNYIDDDFDFTPYTLTFRVCHADKESYYQDVKITQYPAIYAEADMNSDYHNDWNDHNDNQHHGYAFVNGYYSDYYHYGLDKQDYFASLPGYVNRKGSPNMYVFTITSVAGTDYIIGDPREQTISDIVDDPVMYNGSSNRSAWVQARSLRDGDVDEHQRRLTYYYATDGSKATRNMIAPKFRIASAYAVMHTNESPARSLDAMKKRCASYQEDGYPAGRWRLPTQAEFQFIMSQVDKGMMPELYIKGASYWCAHGIGTPRGNGQIEMEEVNTSYQGYSTRCVYDEWYWEDQLDGQEKKHFTWGDRKR